MFGKVILQKYYFPFEFRFIIIEDLVVHFLWRRFYGVGVYLLPYLGIICRNFLFSLGAVDIIALIFDSYWNDFDIYLQIRVISLPINHIKQQVFHSYNITN